MLNDYFKNKPLTLQMPRNDVNFEMPPLYSLTQRITSEKDGFTAKSENNGALRFKY